MCEEMPVIPVNMVVGPKRIIRQKWRVQEEERHKGSLTHKKWSGQISKVINVFVKTHTLLHSIHWCQSWSDKIKLW
jgi:hypothetical protein